MAVLKRMIDRAPIIFKVSITFDVVAKIINVVTRVKPIMVTPKLSEYITPLNVFLYMVLMKRPSTKAKPKATIKSKIDTESTLSKRVNLKI